MSEMTLPQATDHESAAPISRVRYDVRPEDVLDQSTLDGIARKQDEADANVAGWLADEHPSSDALTAEDLRELARRTRQGENITSLHRPS